MGIKRKLARQDMPHKKGKKRCPYCKANAVELGICQSCKAVIKKEALISDIPFVEPSTIDGMAAVGLSLILLKKKKRKQEE